MRQIALQKEYGKWMKDKKLSYDHKNNISKGINKIISDPIMRQKISHKNCISTRKTKKYEITTPNGEIITTNRLNDYCKENDLMISHMFSVSMGVRKHHKNYKCKLISE
jgi:hypothetical protein